MYILISKEEKQMSNFFAFPTVNSWEENVFKLTPAGVITVAVLIVGVATTIILVNNPRRNEIPDDTIIEITEDKNESTKKDNTSSKSDPTVVDGVKLDGGIHQVHTRDI